LAAPLTNALFENFRVETTSAAASAAFKLTAPKLCTFRDVSVDGGSGAGWTTAGIHLLGNQSSGTNSAVNRITNCTIQGCAGDGIKIEDPVGAAAMYVMHNHIQGNYQYGINVPISGTPPLANKSEIRILHNTIEGNQQGQVIADMLIAFCVIGNHFENSASGAGASVIPLQFATRSSGGINGQSFGADVSHNFFNATKAPYCISMGSTTGSLGCTISGNTFNAYNVVNGGTAIAAINLTSFYTVEMIGNYAYGTIPTLYTTTATGPGILANDNTGLRIGAGGAAITTHLSTVVTWSYELAPSSAAQLYVPLAGVKVDSSIAVGLSDSRTLLVSGTPAVDGAYVTVFNPTTSTYVGGPVSLRVDAWNH
jgi:hypothetical protein